MHCVDLGESFPTHIFLQNLASIQPRTSLVKFARSPRTDPSGLTRTELTTVRKEDVEHVLRELPYLREAFESFRDHVLQQRRPGKGQKEGNAFLSTSAAEPKLYNSKSSQQGFHDSDSDVFETEQFQLGRSASGRLRF